MKNFLTGALRTCAIVTAIFVLASSLDLSAMASDLAQPKLITNLHNRTQLAEVQEVALEHDNYDLSFVAFDEEFAKEFGFNPAYITKLEDGLRFIEFQMRTEGDRTNCYYNVILDKSVKLDFPEENYYHQGFVPEIYYQLDPNAVRAKPGTYAHFAKLRAGRKEMNDTRFTNRTYLGNRGYTFHTQEQAFRDGIVGYEKPMFIVQDREVPYTIISLAGGCGTTIWEHPEPALWFRKPGEPETHQPLLKSYHTFEVPPVLVEQIRAVMRTYKKSTNPKEKGGN